MNKALLFFVALFTGVASLWAQPTITNANFPFIDRAIYQPIDTSVSFSKLDTAAASIWEMSSVSPLGVPRIVYYSTVNNHPVFSAATEKAEATVYFGPLPVQQYIYRQKSSAGYHSLGIGYETQKIGLGFLSGTNTDSVTFFAQNYSFANPYTELSFPLTLNTQWVAAAKARTEFFLTLSFVGFNNAPCYFINYFNAKHKAISYGQCKVPAKGGASPLQNILMLKSETTRVDSFYITNAPANPFLLAGLGVNQGDTLRTYQYRFLREGSGAQELAVFYFADSTYSYITAAEYSAEFDVASVGNYTLGQGYFAFPNPTTNGSFNVHLEKPFIAEPVFTLYNTAGQNIPVQAQQVSPNQYTINTTNTPTGVYFLYINGYTKTAPIKLVIK